MLKVIVEWCGVYTQAEYDKKRLLAELCHMSIKIEKKLKIEWHFMKNEKENMRNKNSYCDSADGNI